MGDPQANARRLTVSGGAWAIVLVLSLAVLAVSASARAQQEAVSEEMLSCAAIEDDSSRLACFDRSVAPFLGEAGHKIGDTEQAFAGRGDWTSDAIRMERQWRIAWESQATLLTIALHGAADNIALSLVGTQVGEGDGQTDVLAPGDYRINVSALGGEWRLVIVEE